MKTRFISMSILAVAAVTLFSCAKVENEVVSPEKETVESKGIPFEINVGSIDTKTTNDDYSTYWEAGDQVNLFHEASSVVGTYTHDGAFTAASNGSTSKFTGTIESNAPTSGDTYVWYAMYPYNSKYTQLDGSKYIYIPATQTQAGNSSKAHLSGENCPLGGKSSATEYDATPTIIMKQLTSVVKVVVNNTTTNPITVSRVTFAHSSEKINGNTNLNLTGEDPAWSSSTGSSISVLNVTSGSALPATTGSAEFYIAIKPFTASAGSTVTLTVTTENGTQSVTSAPLGSDFSFVAGKIHQLTFNYTKTFTAQSFVLASGITAGDKVIIASGKADGAVKVMGQYVSGNNILAADGTVSSEAITTTSAMGVYTVGGDSGSGYTFYDAENGWYLNSTDEDGKNYLKGIAAADEWNKWSVTISEGVAEILNKGTGKTSYHIRYNSGNNIFSAYTSAQTPVYIYKLSSKTPVTLSFAESEISKTTDNYGEFTGQAATATPAVTPITYSMTGDPIGTITASTGAVALNGTDGVATVTASYAGDETYAAAAASYTITVIGKNIILSASSENMPTGYGTANTFTEYTLEGYTFKIQQIYKTGAKLQMRAAGNSNGTGTIYNTQVFPGKLNKIIVTYDSSDSNKNCVLHIGASENPTTGSSITPSTSGLVYTFDCSAANVDYFVLENGSGAGYLTSIKIVWK